MAPRMVLEHDRVTGARATPAEPWSTSQFQDGYGGNIPAFAEVGSKSDGDGRFSQNELPDLLAKRWMTLMHLNGDGFLGPDEWAHY